MSRELRRIVVVGASLAGLRACEELRRQSFAGELVVVDAESSPFYDRPPLSKQYLAGTWDNGRIALRPAAAIEALGLELRLGVGARSLDVEGRRLELSNGERLGFDGLVLACGAGARRLPAAVDPAGQAVVLRSRADALALRASLTTEDGPPRRRVVVVGAGFLGLEVAASARQLGCEVEVVEPLAAPLARVLGERVGAAFGALHEANGVRLRLGCAVAGVEAGTPRRRVRVTASSGPRAPSAAVGEASLDADVVLAAIGAAPSDRWLAGSGLELADGVVCDETLTAAPGVVVAGDVARVRRHDGSTERVEHWTTAAEHGGHAARSLLAGPDAEPFSTVHYFWSDQYGLKLQAIGAPRPDADVVVVDGSIEGGRFVACYGRDGVLCAAVGLGRPRELMAYRPMLARPTPFVDAVRSSR